jgi:hypothetical protein
MNKLAACTGMTRPRQRAYNPFLSAKDPKGLMRVGEVAGFFYHHWQGKAVMGFA